ncbi:Protein-L-isoaspartate O-methyltransferase (Protein-beta-aspartate methyltransferase) (PIMT) (Protein L-isoaspartyl methyltransferase) (L-isoaspartyl protein carboxyl methyltransferase) [Sulfurovum sp. enrichment culture clone C5]|uniref:Protein-L-isoaspartate O-methyltransferase n=1 Tax=Sulfurovum sp. enrichment culture clone C5 TaxID=497650 RepID=A0A0S4XNM2_9BACT|nr:Protein-L-isoaspartate O-methyltransferase (Protein-beta-aspartate methyltransferase) (PIMT) (Protein L-isoaspartyl methyltransferase) (L-isoaspartyl protein carboxyl methyltransferase) [Sulfurovum sp. enrichment culture clone C5]
MLKRRLLQRMIEEIEKGFKLDDKVKNAIMSVDRELFVPSVFKHLAYQLDALPLSDNQWISSPLTVAKMTQYLEMDGVDSVLEIGCGSGYQAAVLSKMCRRVFTIERINDLLREAKNRFSQLEIQNVFTRFDDGQLGWRDYAPFERILFSATAQKIPDIIFEQLTEGGILVAPVQEGSMQILTRFYKINGKITSEAIEQCLFVPVIDGRQS